MHFLSLLDLPASCYPQLIKRSLELKQQLKEHSSSPQTLHGKSILLLFTKPSTRTRISFEVGISQMGGNAIFIGAQDSQLSRGEPLRDTARVMSAMADGLIIRNNSHQELQEIAEYATVPVVNALSSALHPCQLLADLVTYQELRGEIKGKKVVWFGDGNNMCNSYLEAAATLDFHLVIAAPPPLLPAEHLLTAYQDHLSISTDPAAAIKDAHLVCTDVWVSMGDTAAASKRAALQPFQVTTQLLEQADPAVLFMHCLPANEGEEIAAGLLDDPRSGVWVQSENRLHAQKALLELLFS